MMLCACGPEPPYMLGLPAAGSDRVLKVLRHIHFNVHAANRMCLAGGCEDVVAVVDPPRAGLHKNVVRALLKCSALKRLVVVSCNPDSCAENLAMFCSPPSNGAP